MSMMRSQNKSRHGVRAYVQQSTVSSDAALGTREEIFEQHRSRILLIARRIAERIPQGSSLTSEDLVSYGAIGLLEAIDRYDATRNNQFSTYADFRIRGAMIDALRSVDDMSRHRREQARDIDVVTSSLARKLRRPPTKQEISDEMGISLEQYHKLLHKTAPVSQTSLDASLDSSEDDGGLLDIIADQAAVDPLTVVLNNELRADVEKAINTLSTRKRQCVILYYGRNMNLSEIAAVFDLTPSRISQILSTARKELRTSLQDTAKINGYFTNEDEE